MSMTVESVVEFLYAAKPASWTPEQRSHMWNACGLVIGNIKKASAPAQPTGGEHAKRALQEIEDGQTNDRSNGKTRQLRASEAREPERVRKEGRRNRRRDKGRSKSRRG